MGVIRISLLSGRACCLNCSEDQLIQQVLRQAEDWELMQQFSKSIHFLTKESQHHFTFSSCSKSSNFTSPGSITAEFAGLGVSTAIWLSKSLSSSPTCGWCDSTRYAHPRVAGDSEEITVGGTQQDLRNVLKGIGRDLEGLIYIFFTKGELVLINHWVWNFDFVDLYLKLI